MACHTAIDTNSLSHLQSSHARSNMYIRIASAFASDLSIIFKKYKIILTISENPWGGN